MSRQQFSKKKHGKSVPTYPLGTKAKTSASKGSRRSSKGRPRKPKPEPMQRKTILTLDNPGDYNDWQLDLMLREKLENTDEVLLEVPTYKCRSITPRGVYPKRIEVTYYTKPREKRMPLQGSSYRHPPNTRVWTEEEKQAYWRWKREVYGEGG